MTEFHTLTRRVACAAVALLAGFALPAHALTYLVGGGAVPSQCDYTSLQAAINAASANPGEDFIRVANDQTYTAQALTIGQQDLTITGGYATCTAALPAGALPAGMTVLNGSGGAAASVVSITGSGVRVLSSVQIRNGDNVQANGTGCGGGIRFEGRGELRLGMVGISQNHANQGGGLCAIGTGTPAVITLESDVSISSNEAATANGGGIRVSGSAHLVLVSDRTLIAFNTALNGSGGGIYQLAPARVEIGSPGLNGLGVMYANEAQRGGAISVEVNGDDGACLDLYTTDPARPVRMQANRASVAGGALYLNSVDGIFDNSSSFAAIKNVVIDGNSAPNGAAIFMDSDSDIYAPTVTMNAPSYCAAASEPLGAAQCNAGVECNRIENNQTRDFSDQATNGNVIEMRGASALFATGMTISGNRGTRLISWSGSDEGAYVKVDRSALVANTLTQELFRGFHEGAFELIDSTVAGNVLGGALVLRHDSSTSGNVLRNSVIDQPGKLTLSHPNITSLDNQNTWIVATDTSTLRPDPTLIQASARLVDPAHGDYRLRIGSQAVDLAPGTVPAPATDVDLDGRPRNIDLQNVSSNTRARDVGAFERQQDDPWVTNGDFVEDLRLWSNPNAAHATWDGSANAPGSVGGSLSFLVPVGQVGPNERRTALSYCFNVPSPGTYQLHGRALSGVPMSNRDYPVMAWRVRYASADCSGAEAASGQAFFARSGSTWQTFAAGTPSVAIDPAQWTWNTTIELLLEVAQDPISTSATSLFARFDEIEISKLGAIDAIFRDGFESL